MPKKPSNERIWNCVVSDADDAALIAYMEAHGLTRSEVTRRALAKLIGKKTADPVKPGRPWPKKEAQQ